VLRVVRVLTIVGKFLMRLRRLSCKRTGSPSRDPCRVDERAEGHLHGFGMPTMTEGDVMADSGTLHDAFLDELRDMFDAERQLTKALPKLARAATTPALKTAFETHLEETNGHIDRLERVFETLDEKPRGKHCEGIAGIIEEGSSIMGEDFDEATMDACLIASGQRAEHYEMAAYGTLIAWARVMGHQEIAQMLQETLDEEKAADEKLTSLAEGGINQEAGDAMQSSGEADDEDEEEEDEEEEEEDDENADATAGSGSGGAVSEQKRPTAGAQRSRTAGRN